MARNGSGTYSKVNTFVAGTTITASDHNENWDDIASEVTNSVAADGQTTMSGPLKAASGTVAAPGISFASDLDCGLYRIGSNNVGLALGGAKVVDFLTSGIDVTGYVDGDDIKQGGSTLIPAGSMIDYAGSSAPDGWLFCYGQAVSRTTYAALFTAIGTTYGAGDGSTTFNLPDCRGRVIAGKDDMGGSSANRLTNQSGGLNGDTLGATGGAETHTLTVAQMPAHDHGGATGNPTTNPATADQSGQSGATGGSAVLAPGSNDDKTLPNHVHTISSQGGDGAHNNVQPTIILNKLIKY